MFGYSTTELDQRGRLAFTAWRSAYQSRRFSTLFFLWWARVLWLSEYPSLLGSLWVACYSDPLKTETSIEMRAMTQSDRADEKNSAEQEIQVVDNSAQARFKQYFHEGHTIYDRYRQRLIQNNANTLQHDFLGQKTRELLTWLWKGHEQYIDMRYRIAFATTSDLKNSKENNVGGFTVTVRTLAPLYPQSEPSTHYIDQDPKGKQRTGTLWDVVNIPQRNLKFIYDSVPLTDDDVPVAIELIHKGSKSTALDSWEYHESCHTAVLKESFSGILIRGSSRVIYDWFANRARAVLRTTGSIPIAQSDEKIEIDYDDEKPQSRCTDEKGDQKPTFTSLAIAQLKAAATQLRDHEDIENFYYLLQGNLDGLTEKKSSIDTQVIQRRIDGMLSDNTFEQWVKDHLEKGLLRGTFASLLFARGVAYHVFKIKTHSPLKIPQMLLPTILFGTQTLLLDLSILTSTYNLISYRPTWYASLVCLVGIAGFLSRKIDVLLPALKQHRLANVSTWCGQEVPIDNLLTNMICYAFVIKPLYYLSIIVLWLLKEVLTLCDLRYVFSTMAAIMTIPTLPLYPAVALQLDAFREQIPTRFDRLFLVLVSAVIPAIIALVGLAGKNHCAALNIDLFNALMGIIPSVIAAILLAAPAFIPLRRYYLNKIQIENVFTDYHTYHDAALLGLGVLSVGALIALSFLLEVMTQGAFPNAFITVAALAEWIDPIAQINAGLTTLAINWSAFNLVGVGLLKLKWYCQQHYRPVNLTHDINDSSVNEIDEERTLQPAVVVDTARAIN